MNYGVFKDSNVITCINLRNFDKLSQIEIDKENKESSYQLLSVKQVQIINEITRKRTNNKQTTPKFSFNSAINKKFFEYILDEQGSFNLSFEQVDLKKDIVSVIENMGLYYLLDKYHTFSHFNVRVISSHPEYFISTNKQQCLIDQKINIFCQLI
eukprot:403350619